MFEHIKEKLSHNACLVENALANYYDYSNKDYDSLIKTQKYGLLGGGKRIRAFLVLEVCRLLSADIENALPYACAIEMIHASSLIHDDMPIMDNDDVRRGKPATHKQFGETLALLAGDAMLVKAFEIAVNNPYLDFKTNTKAVAILAESTGDNGMLAGQAMDTVGTGRALDFETLLKLHRLKTGRLISASAKLGCLAAGVSETDEKYLSAVKYAECIGLAFQIVDDILDYQEGKIESNSFISFMCVEKAREYAEMLTEEGKNAIAEFDDGTLCELANYLTVREY